MLSSAAQALSPGRYDGRVAFKNLASGATTAVNVTFAVSPRPGQLAISGADSLSFSGQQGGAFSPPRHSLQLKAVGAGFQWSRDGTRYASGEDRLAGGPRV
jgi:hypothetical protein